ncbi:MAG: hypothetical protein Q9198_006290, partial [Flavoplaca austrocitrina]
LNANNLRKKNDALNQSITACLANSIDRYTPNESHAKPKKPADRCTPTSISQYAPTSDYYPPKCSTSGSVDRYIPTDRYTPQPGNRGAADPSKRPRESSPEEDVEVMTEIINQVNRISKRVARLEDRPGPQKRKKLATQSLAVALRASVEELLYKTKDIVH